VDLGLEVGKDLPQTFLCSRRIDQESELPFETASHRPGESNADAEGRGTSATVAG